MKNTTTNMNLSLLFRWLHGKITVTQNNIQISMPTTMLGVIPVGTADQNIPMSNITASQVVKHVYGKMLIGGLFLMLMGESSFSLGDRLPGILIMAIGAIVVIGSFKETLVIQRGGSDYAVSVPFTQGAKLRAVQGAICEALDYTENKKDVTANTDRIIDVLERK